MVTAILSPPITPRAFSFTLPTQDDALTGKRSACLQYMVDIERLDPVLHKVAFVPNHFSIPSCLSVSSSPKSIYGNSFTPDTGDGRL